MLALVLAGASVTLAAPLGVALVLGGWFAVVARPLWRRLGRALGGRERIAAVLSLLLLLVALAPVLLAIVSLTVEAAAFVKRILATPGGAAALQAMVSEGATTLGPADLLALVEQHGSRALQVAGAVVGATARGGLGLFVFVLASYTFLVEGASAYAWLEQRLPLHPAHLRRLADAFHETGRGLLVGIGLTALIQGGLATLAYVALGIPSALALGLLTALGAIVPGVGTALVWVPVAAGLLLSGRWASAVVLSLVGVLVIGTVDNLLRPVLARHAKLRLPTLVLCIAIFGGLTVFGPWGVVVGPLVARLTREVLDLHQEMG